MKRIAAMALVVAGFTLALSSVTACSGALAQPFEQLKTAPVTVYRLQNYEPPAATPGAALPGVQIPPQIQTWLGGAAQLLPPGLLPPGLIPGSAPAAPTDGPRFYNFRILGQMAVSDTSMRNEILDIFGHESNFEAPRQSCMYAEFGFQLGAGGAPAVQGAPPSGSSADILVSLSCDQVQMAGWPYAGKTGIKPDTAKRIIAVARRAFGG